MGLSAHEQEMLAQLERQFKEDDPKFAAVMDIKAVPRYSVWRIGSASAAVLVGVYLVFLGASGTGVIVNTLFGGLGFGLMVTGAYVALQRKRIGSGARGQASTSQTDELPVDENQDKGRGKGKDKRRRSFRDGFGDLAMWSLFWWV